MSKYENVPIPFEKVGNRQFLSDRALAEDEQVEAFVERFPHCFERDDLRKGLWFWPEGVPNGTG